MKRADDKFVQQRTGYPFQPVITGRYVGRPSMRGAVLLLTRSAGRLRDGKFADPVLAGRGAALSHAAAVLWAIRLGRRIPHAHAMVSAPIDGKG